MVITYIVISIQRPGKKKRRWVIRIHYVGSEIELIHIDICSSAKYFLHCNASASIATRPSYCMCGIPCQWPHPFSSVTSVLISLSLWIVFHTPRVRFCSRPTLFRSLPFPPTTYSLSSFSPWPVHVFYDIFYVLYDLLHGLRRFLVIATIPILIFIFSCLLP